VHRPYVSFLLAITTITMLRHAVYEPHHLITRYHDGSAFLADSGRRILFQMVFVAGKWNAVLAVGRSSGGDPHPNVGTSPNINNIVSALRTAAVIPFIASDSLLDGPERKITRARFARE